MRLVKMFGLAAVAAVAALAFVGATSASATDTQLCKVHTGLTCEAGNAVTSHHMVLASGSIGKLLAAINVLCLGILIEATPLGLGNPQLIHTTSFTFTGCGTSSAHNNCTVTTLEQPLANLLKTGLDEGVLAFTNGQLGTVCANLGINCVYDGEGMEFNVGAGHLTAGETPVTELGGKFLCPDEGFVDALYETLGNAYALK